MDQDGEDLQRRDDAQFQKGLRELLRDAEHVRVEHMKRHRGRQFMATTVGLVALVAGAAGFGWFFLMQADLLKALACIALALSIPLSLHLWTRMVLQAYIAQHKKKFMPRMADLLGGFSFFPARGISAKVLKKTGVVPAHDRYRAEDCFTGRYKGIKVIFSEARLFHKNHKTPVFKGLFVMLEVPHDVFSGHSIITADKEMVTRWESTRWKSLSPVSLPDSDVEWDRFLAFSDKPEEASLILGERLLKELFEASLVFDNAPLTAVLFRKKYIFLMIPHDRDMFEASHIHIPITTKQHATSCKKEIEQLLEIIDVFDLYNADGSDLSSDSTSG